MKKYINYIAVALLAAFSLSSCKSLDVAPPNNITDEQIQKILEEGDESAKNLIINLVGTGLENFFNISGQTWTGYSSYPLNSQIDQDYLMSLRGNDVIPGTAVTASSGHETAYELIKTFSLTDNTYPYYALSASMLTGANKALLYLTPEAAKAGANARKYRGQALAVRAYAYMQLMERFQPAYTNGGKDGKGMPIYKSYGTNDPAPISSATDTYKFLRKWAIRQSLRMLTVAWLSSFLLVPLCGPGIGTLVSRLRLRLSASSLISSRRRTTVRRMRISRPIAMEPRTASLRITPSLSWPPTLRP